MSSLFLENLKKEKKRSHYLCIVVNFSRLYVRPKKSSEATCHLISGSMNGQNMGLVVQTFQIQLMNCSTSPKELPSTGYLICPGNLGEQIHCQGRYPVLEILITFLMGSAEGGREAGKGDGSGQWRAALKGRNLSSVGREIQLFSKKLSLSNNFLSWKNHSLNFECNYQA